MLTAIILLVTVALVYVYLTSTYRYWKNRDVPHPPTIPGFGNLLEVMLQRKSLGPALRDAYMSHKDFLYFGFYKLRQPSIVLRDTDLIAKVLVKDFSSFHKNDWDINEKIDPLFGKSPFVIDGERWKTGRNQIIPTFTVGKMKIMFQRIAEVTTRLTDYLSNEVDFGKGEGVEVKELCGKYTTDVVANFSVGINAHSFENDNAEFRRLEQRMHDSGFLSGFKRNLIVLWPTLAYIFNCKILEDDVTEFFRRIVRETIQDRKEKGIVRNDFLDYMLRLQEKMKNSGFSEDDIAVHLMTVCTDGYEMTFLVLSFALYELSVNPEVCKKLRKEIDDVLTKYNGEITYDGIQEMLYLDHVLSESLRKYPPLSFMAKRCTNSYVFPNPLGDYRKSDVKIERGTPVYISILALHHDPKYFPDPEKFDPDRFSEERKHSIAKYSYIPFGDGPRICLGMRFAIVLMKAALVAIVSHFDMKIHPKTSHPVEIDPSYFLLSAKDGIWINFSKRK